MKWLLALLTVLLIFLQVRLWFGEGSMAHVTALKRQIVAEQKTIAAERERNRELAMEVEQLRHGTDAVEGEARRDLGMIRDGETYFMLLDSQ